ncbi:hypothetical protein BH09BAC5_BH09BAC5_07840 [soil metagenome]
MGTTKNYLSRSRQEKAQLVEQWKQSGKTNKAFALEHNLCYQSFIGWFYLGKEKNANDNSFVALQVKDEHTGIFAKIVLKNGSSICFHERVGVEYFQFLLR